MSEKDKIEIEYMPVSALVPYARNSKKHPPEQVAKIAGWIREVGFINPIVIDGDGTIVAGHGRALAAERLGMKDVPVIRAAHLTPAQIKAHRLADNKLGDTDYDPELLRIELMELDSLQMDLESLGYSEQELKRLLDPSDEENLNQDPGLDFSKMFEVVVECSDEDAQREVYERLSKEGLKCRVLSM